MRELDNDKTHTYKIYKNINPTPQKYLTNNPYTNLYGHTSNHTHTCVHKSKSYI